MIVRHDLKLDYSEIAVKSLKYTGPLKGSLS